VGHHKNRKLAKNQRKISRVTIKYFEKATSIVFKKAFPKIDPRNEKKIFCTAGTVQFFFLINALRPILKYYTPEYQNVINQSKDFNNEIEKMTNKVYTTLYYNEKHCGKA